MKLIKANQLKIKALRISTILNVKADALSRSSHPSLEWEIPQETFQKLINLRGPMEVDLMATRQNTKLTQFVSPHPDLAAIAHNALAVDWNQWKEIYIFPPSMESSR